jgi:glyoxylase-like metal-dependent hydrolase (beta-lactamase superfamily II)
VSTNPDLYFRQLKLGDLENFIYLIGSRKTKMCLVVDPAWDTDAILEVVQKDGMTISGALVTHYHPDHVGGEAIGLRVPGGVADLLARANAPIHVHKMEADGLRRVTGVSKSDLRVHGDGDTLEIGDVKITLVHTPGHTPGSQCFYVQDRLVSGDTLFVGACGRVDLPGGDPEQMLETLSKRLSKFTDDVILYPGHDYGPKPSSSLGEQRITNRYLRMRSLDDWLDLWM